MTAAPRDGIVSKKRREVGYIAGMAYGYIRVSSKDQREDRQRIALRERSVPEKNIYTDRQSGKDFDRPQYKRLLRNVFENEHSFRYAITCRIRIIPW